MKLNYYMLMLWVQTLLVGLILYSFKRWAEQTLLVQLNADYELYNPMNYILLILVIIPIIIVINSTLLKRYWK